MYRIADLIAKIKKLPHWLIGYYIALGIALNVVGMSLYSDRRSDRYFNDVLEIDQEWDAWFELADSLQQETFQLMTRVETLVEKGELEPGLKERHPDHNHIVAGFEALKAFPQESAEVIEHHLLLSHIQSTQLLGHSLFAFADSLLAIPWRSVEKVELAEGQVEVNFGRFILALRDVQNTARDYHIHAVAKETANLRARRNLNLVVHITALLALIASAAYGLRITRRLSGSEHRRKLQGQRLADGDARFKALVANVPGGVFRFVGGRDGQAIYISSGVWEIIGCTEAGSTDQAVSFNELIFEEDFRNLLRIISAATPDNAEYEAEYQLNHSDGRTIWIWERGRVVFNDSHKIESIDGVVFEITDKKTLQQEVQESEQRLLKITAGLPGVVYQFKVDSHGEMSFPFMSDAAQSMFQLDLEEIRGDASSVFAKLHPDDLPRIMESVFETHSSLGSWEQEFRVFVDGKEKWIRGTSLPHRWPDGSVIWNGLLVDISSEREAKDKHKASEERFRLLIENQGEGLALVDANETFTFANPAAARIFGYSQEELVGMTIRDITTDVEYAHTQEARNQFGNNEKVVLRTKILRKDGDERNVEVTLSPDYWDGELKGTLGVIRDITEQVRAQEALRESEARFQTIFRDLDISMVTANLDGTFRGVNRAFIEFIGYSEDQLLGMNVADVTHPEDVDLVRTAVRELKESGGRQPIHIEHRYVSSNGVTKWGEVSATLYLDETTGSRYFIVMMENISERKLIEKRLEESEGLYRLLFEGSTDGYLLLAHQVVDCNRQLCEILGYTRDELVGMNPHQFSPEFQPDGGSSEQAAKELIRRAMDGRPQRFYWKHQRKDGLIIDTEVALKLIKIRGENLVLAGIRDITEQLRQEREIRSTLVRINTLVKSAVDGIVSFDEEGKIELINPAAAKIFECEYLEAIGRDFFEFLTAPGADSFRARLMDRDKSRKLHEGISDEDLVGIRMKSKSRFPISLAVNPMPIEDELKFVATLRDITERKIAEQKIRENESKLNTILDSAAEGIIVVDEQGCILNFNRAAERIFGCTVVEGECNSVNRIIPSLDPIGIAADQPSGSYETQGIHRERGTFPLQVSFSTVALDDIKLVTLIVRDKTFENEQRDKMIESDKYMSIGTLAAGIAHEFKNYLAGIIGHASFAKDFLDDPGGRENAKEAFDQIVEIGEKANDVAMSLLTYSRKSTDELEFVSINELVTATLNFGRNEIRGEDIQIVEKLESTGKVRANANQLQQVIFNLLLNAKQAIARSGVLTVVTKETESHVVLKIGDTGVGIEINDMKRIFDPFFSTKGVWGEGKSQGTGLGLFICKNILSKIGAEISVQSKLGLGTTFTVKIPVSGEKAASGKLPTGLRNVVVASINAGLIKRLHRIVESDSTVTFSVADADDFERVAETIEAEASLVLVDLNGLHPLDAEAIIERVQLHAFKSLIITGQGSALPANISPNQLSVTAANPPDLDTIVAAFLARPGSPQPASNSR